jgi:hypothetical protein
MDWESLFNSASTNKARDEMLRMIQESNESWGDIVAMYSGMVKQLQADGWEEIAARSIVLSNVTAANIAIAANIAGAFDGKKEEGDSES